MTLSNNTKIKFCNAVCELERHRKGCVPCSDYLAAGDGDLCEKGKQLIAFELVYADTSPVFPDFPGELKDESCNPSTQP